MDGRIRNRETKAPAPDLRDTMHKYKAARSVLGFERRQVEKLRKEGKAAEAAAAQQRVDEQTARVAALKAELNAEHRLARMPAEHYRKKAEAAQFIRE